MSVRHVVNTNGGNKATGISRRPLPAGVDAIYRHSTWTRSLLCIRSFEPNIAFGKWSTARAHPSGYLKPPRVRRWMYCLHCAVGLTVCSTSPVEGLAAVAIAELPDSLVNRLRDSRLLLGRNALNERAPWRAVDTAVGVTAALHIVDASTAADAGRRAVPTWKGRTPIRVQPNFVRVLATEPFLPRQRSRRVFPQWAPNSSCGTER
jgi:hypothetical protein